MTGEISYVVRIAFDGEIPEAYVTWLREHVTHVCAAGAERGEIVRVDGAPVLEARYWFASRESFARYEREDAPRLRREGLEALARIGAAATFARATGEIV